ncbi:hypothetical protein K5I04_07000 [Murdochiella sp. Marseille-P8839]|nr:hypothetical protein [Murdochiella sp. Marseille-P8839]
MDVVGKSSFGDGNAEVFPYTLIAMVVVCRKWASTTIVFAVGDGGGLLKTGFHHHRFCGWGWWWSAENGLPPPSFLALEMVVVC